MWCNICAYAHLQYFIIKTKQNKTVPLGCRNSKPTLELREEITEMKQIKLVLIKVALSPCQAE